MKEIPVLVKHVIFGYHTFPLPCNKYRICIRCIPVQNASFKNNKKVLDTNDKEREGTYFPTPYSWVMCVQSSYKYPAEKFWIRSVFVFWSPSGVISFIISSAGTTKAVAASGTKLKNSNITSLTYITSETIVTNFTEYLLNLSFSHRLWFRINHENTKNIGV